jgi:hypothetical protein
MVRVSKSYEKNNSKKEQNDNLLRVEGFLKDGMFL